MLARNTKKILFPYFLTCILILICKFFEGDVFWGLSIIYGNTKKYVWYDHILRVGPLWFLTAFFVAMIYTNLIYRITSKKLRWGILLLLFTISIIFTKTYGFLLPFGITTACGGVIFIFAGMEIKHNSIFIQDKRFLYPGILIWILCVFFGWLAMYAHEYKLFVFQIIGGVYGTIVCYKFALSFSRQSKLWKCFCYIGSNTLAILCIHSIDRMLNITSYFTRFLMGGYTMDIKHWQLEVFLKLLYVAIVFIIFKNILPFKKIFQIV